ncbi:MAG: hypothetical protein KC422_19090 [Trueperaceae bacterium]|nr:hypothetical protein [Trueperaceae bacterium]
MATKTETIFGVRHHGPGSARALVKALHAMKPDLVLVEGPSDLSPMLKYLGHEELEPPVALVSYQLDNPGKASYFPFAVFSPEYQAIRFALDKKLPVRFFDLPQSQMMAAGVMPAMPAQDPLVLIAKASGHRHYERWWNTLVEERRGSKDVFDGVLELMSALRESDVAYKTEEDKPIKLEPKLETVLEQAKPEMAEQLRKQLEAKRKASLRLADQREAHMRQTIRQARSEGFCNIAIVCGAFHGPALLDIEESYLEADDFSLLRDMPELAIEAAWVPWSYSRLASSAGYGAGVASPAWYQHLWEQGDERISSAQFASIWLTKVSGFLREQGFAISSAHTIETVRLAEALAALREQTYPGLPELMEATQTVMCAGNGAPLALIQKQLIIGERLGFVPADFPMVPLQRDLLRQQQDLKLRPELKQSSLKLDLRNELHLRRSQFLHRLRLLEIPWGESQTMRAKSGSFREIWTLEWKPEYVLKVIEASRFGTTVETAATALAQEKIQKAETLDTLSQLLDISLLADLQGLIEPLIERIRELTTASSDVDTMMRALAPLVRVMRYGTVRQGQEGQDLVDAVVKTLCSRIPIHLPKACLGLRDEVAKERCELIVQTHSVVASLVEQKQAWQACLIDVAEHEASHGLIAGKVTRLLASSRVFSPERVQIYLERYLHYQLSQGYSVEDLMRSAFWIEGFFKGSALTLIHDEQLFHQLDAWLLSVPEESFMDILPLLRRTFAGFSKSSRAQLQDKAKGFGQVPQLQPAQFDEAQAAQILPTLAKLLGRERLAVPSAPGT